MKKILALAVAALLIPATAALAGPPAPKKEGIEGKDYKWNAQEGEKIEALKLKGDAKAGKEGYEICGACHLPSGAGRPDGTFPQLAGQHTTVLIKQMADIREGLRDNPTMYPFAKELTDAQELANVSAYIESLCTPLDHGKDEGGNNPHGTPCPFHRDIRGGFWSGHVNYFLVPAYVFQICKILHGFDVKCFF